MVTCIRRLMSTSGEPVTRSNRCCLEIYAMENLSELARRLVADLLQHGAGAVWPWAISAAMAAWTLSLIMRIQNLRYSRMLLRRLATGWRCIWSETFQNNHPVTRLVRSFMSLPARFASVRMSLAVEVMHRRMILRYILAWAR